jgi:hypothetical protein
MGATNKPFNPFEGRNREEVWQEIRENSTPISQEEMVRQMQSNRRADATGRGEDNNPESGNE